MNIERPTILLLEQDPLTRDFLADNLHADGYAVLPAESVAQAEVYLNEYYPDLALLGVGEAGEELELVRAIRAAHGDLARVDPDLPVVMVSGRASEIDRLRGFERGCDDYVSIPFSYPELRMRMQALLRRTRMRPLSGRVRIGPLEVDPLSRAAWLRGEKLKLSNKEFGLLRALVTEPTRAFAREELLRIVWGFRSMGTTRTLDSHASRLRAKLSVQGDSFVLNVWGVGYKLCDGKSEPASAEPGRAAA
jgi:DNA-binding response OmpR family regulator